MQLSKATIFVWMENAERVPPKSTLLYWTHLDFSTKTQIIPEFDFLLCLGQYEINTNPEVFEISFFVCVQPIAGSSQSLQEALKPCVRAPRSLRTAAPQDGVPGFHAAGKQPSPGSHVSCTPTRTAACTLEARQRSSSVCTTLLGGGITQLATAAAR